VAKIPKVPRTEFEAVIKALLSTPPTPAKAIAGKRPRKADAKRPRPAEARLTAQSGCNPVRVATMLYAVRRDFLFHSVKTDSIQRGASEVKSTSSLIEFRGVLA